MNIVLGFVFLLCVLLLLMIFGEQLSVLGTFHGRWLSNLSESIAALWDFLSEEIDRGWRFVLEHLWWVLAVGSGSSGVALVAWMIFGGIAEQAAADLAVRSGQMHAGGILDQVPEITSRKGLPQAVVARSEGLIIARISQVPSPLSRRPNTDWNLRTSRIRDRESVTDDQVLPLPDLTEQRFRNFEDPQRKDRNFSSEDRDRLPTLEPERGFRTQRSTPLFSQLNEEFASDDDSIIQISGTTITSGTLKTEIETALDRLKFQSRDEWRRHERFPERSIGYSEFGSDLPSVRESTSDELNTIKSSVRIVPGSIVGDSDLRIEKRLFPTQQQNEFDIEISVTNQSRRRMSSLLVHEHLPFQLQPAFIRDGGVYRNSTVTWVVDDLRPLNTQMVRVRVRSESDRGFDTQTVISATAAVASELVVESDRRSEFIPDRPEVQLSMSKVRHTARLSEKFEISFQLNNVGTAPAAEVSLRVELPPGLDHFRVDKDDVDRNVVVTVRNLQPNTSRIKLLKLQAAEPGEQTAVVEMLENGSQTDLRAFTIQVLDDDPADSAEPRPPLPQPDELIPLGRG